MSELQEEMQRCEFAHSAMLQDVGNKDERIKVWLLPSGPSHVLLSTRLKHRHKASIRGSVFVLMSAPHKNVIPCTYRYVTGPAWSEKK